MAQPTNEPLTIDRRGGWRLLGISERTFCRLEGAGLVKPVMPPSGRRPARYDLGELVLAYIAWKLGSAESPRDRRERSQAELNELRLGRERGELLRRADVARAGAAYTSPGRRAGRLESWCRVPRRAPVWPLAQAHVVRQPTRRRRSRASASWVPDRGTS